MQLTQLVRAARGGDRRAMARLITQVENDGEAALAVQNEIFPHTGRAHLLGITGPAGAGKSTLISQLAAQLSAAGHKVGVVACDPSSPDTGGALLGDRVRMHSLACDDNVFIRSIATRGSSGGLPLAAFRSADVLDACGFDTVIIETVGTGQNQVDIMQAAHTVVTVSAPGLGDEIQAMKSGLLEVADIHAVTKSDLDAAAKTLREIEIAVHLRKKGAGTDAPAKPWRVPVVAVEGRSGKGVDELWRSIRSHIEFLQQDDHLLQRCRRMYRQRIYREALSILSRRLGGDPDPHFNDSLERVIRREQTPSGAASEFIHRLK